MKRGYLLSSTILVSIAGCAAACGPPPAPPAPPKPVVEKPVAVEKPVDLSPVPPPERIIFVAQVRKPNDIKKTITDWTRFPLPGGEPLAEAALGKPVGDIVDMDQPIRAIGIITGSGKKAKPTFVGSIPLVAFDQAKRQIEGVYSLTAIDNGDFQINGVEDSDGAADDRRSCFLAHSAGPSNAALVCGIGPETQKLVPYLVRTAVKDVPEKDVHVELRLSPARDELRLGLSMLPAGLAAITGAGGNNPAVGDMFEAGAADVSDFVLDVDKLTLDASFGDKALQGEFATSFETRRALITQLGLSHADKNAAPPAALWHLPSDTDFAVWGSGVDGKLIEHPKDLVMRAIAQAAKEEKMSDADNKALSDALSHSLALTSSPTLYAKGYDENGIKAAIDKEREVAALPRETISQAIGWHLWRVEEPITKVGPATKEWVSAWSRPTFQKWAKDHISKNHLAQVKVTPVAATAKLPKDTIHVEISLPVDEPDLPTAPPPPMRPGDPKAAKPKPVVDAKVAKKTPQKPVVIHMYVVPDAGATTLAFGLDDKLVAAKALASLSTSPDNETLKGRQGYEAVRDIRASAGGFITMHAVVGAAKMGDDPTRKLAGLSNNARTPIIFSFASSGANATAKEGAMTTSVRIPKDFILDAMKMGMR